MGESAGLSASDIALLNGRNNYMGQDSPFLWIFALLILANGGFGNWGNNNFQNAIGYENLATSNELQRGFDNQNLQNQTSAILAAVNSGTAQTVAASNQVFHDLTGYVGDKYDELQRDVAGLAVGQANALANQNSCCCDIKMLIAEAIAGVNANIAQSKYEAAMNTAAINENITAQAQRMIDTYNGNRMADMQSRINNLELQNQLSNVVRYPSNTFYSVPSPCFNNCNGGFGNM